MKEKQSQILVTFKHDVSLEEIEEIFEGKDLIFTEIPGILKRYALEVPVSKKQQIMDLFANFSAVWSVYPYEEQFAPKRTYKRK